jgi:hypothetical protein
VTRHDWYDVVFEKSGHLCSTPRLYPSVLADAQVRERVSTHSLGSDSCFTPTST